MTLYDLRISDAQRELLLTAVIAVQMHPSRLGSDLETSVMLDELEDMLSSAVPHDSNDAEAQKTLNDFTL